MILFISGQDTSGLAGIDADLRALPAGHEPHQKIITGVYNANSETNKFQETPFSFFTGQVNQVFAGYRITTVKIGALFSKEQIDFLVQKIKSVKLLKGLTVVLDTVLAPSAGGEFCTDEDSYKSLVNLAKISTIVTPNSKEFAALYPENSIKVDGFFVKKNRLNAILLKGGHESNKVDRLAMDGMTADFSSDIYDREFRGTGCFLASLIARELECGMSLVDSVTTAMWAFNVSMRDAHVNGRDKMRAVENKDVTCFPKVKPIGFSNIIEKSPSLELNQNSRVYPVVETVRLFEEMRKESPFILQLRLKGLPLNAVRDQLKELSPKKVGEETLLVLNDYDRAVDEFEFDGIHIGQEDLFVADIEAIKSKKLLLGISTHGYFELAIAMFFKPSYVALGPVFETVCKSMSFGPQGYDKLRIWKDLLGDIPLVGIGGLNIERSKEAIKYGADIVAIQSDITLSQNPTAQIKKYHSAEI